VLTGDARCRSAGRRRTAYDLVIGDAFGGVAVPWHLATLEFTQQLHDTLRPAGST
jgi:spermidine synthase